MPKSERAREVKRRGQATVRGERRRRRGMRKHLDETAKPRAGRSFRLKLTRKRRARAGRTR